ncbi:unnamed protein product [Adineta steineri]|uniref:NHL repeat containing protein n=3 Tax=Adineta steineri TaxID=433720 RepID=A0A818WFP9_9BILA|nr:unnamed protein product [Adineta steineri]
MTDNEHHQKLIEQIDEIENHRNLFQKKFIQHKQNLEEHSLIKQINQWEHDSIIKTKQTTEGFTGGGAGGSSKRSLKLIETSKNEINQELIEPRNIFIEETSTLFINKIDLIDRSNTKWKEFRINIAEGNELGKEMNQLNYPINMIINKENDCFIISDYQNKRIMQCSRQNNENRQTIMSNINCYGLAIDKYGFIYVSDYEKHEVRKFKIRDQNGKLVAGGNEK